MKTFFQYWYIIILVVIVPKLVWNYNHITCGPVYMIAQVDMRRNHQLSGGDIKFSSVEPTENNMVESWRWKWLNTPKKKGEQIIDTEIVEKPFVARFQTDTILFQLKITSTEAESVKIMGECDSLLLCAPVNNSIKDSIKISKSICLSSPAAIYASNMDSSSHGGYWLLLKIPRSFSGILSELAPQKERTLLLLK